VNTFEKKSVNFFNYLFDIFVY